MNKLNQLTTAAAFFFLLIYGCGTQKINSPEIIHMEKILDNFVPVNLSEFTDSIEYIKLETNDRFLLDNISQIDVKNNLVLMVDNTNCILFNESGKFLAKIGNKGNGPGEYRNHIQAKIGHNVVFVLSMDKVLVYNHKGVFLQEVNIPYSIHANKFNNSFFPTSDSTFLLQVPLNIEGNQLAELNLNGSLTRKYFKEKSETRRLGTIATQANIYIHGGKISYKGVLNDTLFRIHNSTISPKYIFNFGKYSFPPEAIYLEMDEYYNLSSKSIHLSNFVETTNYFFLILSLQKNSPKDFINEKKINNEIINVGNQWLGIYSKPDKRLRLSRPSGYKDEINYTGIYNDLDGGLSVFPKQRVDDSSFVTFFYPYELKNYTSSKEFRNKKVKNQEMKEKLIEFAKNISFDDNPVLVRVRMKNIN